MQIHCKACGEVVSLENINLATSVATCGACDLVFSAERQLTQNNEFPNTELQYPLANSDVIDIATFGDDIYITRHWRTSNTQFKVIIAAGIILFIFGKYLESSGMFDSFPLSFFASVFAPTFILWLAQRFTKTQIIICLDELIVRHRPLPWLAIKKIPTNDIKQIYCVENISGKQGNQKFTYRLYASLLDGSNQRLLSYLPTYQQARAIENALERHLRIRHRPKYDRLSQTRRK